MSILLPDTKANPAEPLAELTALAESAGLQVVDSMVQKRTGLTSAHGLGTGKLAELAERAAAIEADVVVFDNELSPRQIRGVEEVVQRKVIDRSELILDIFAARARTREAQLQVELAQLQYTSPRIRGLWTHLERIAGAGGGTAAGAVGGVGTRGPGERQIEIDRRIVKERIRFLTREIEQIDRRKEREVLARHDRYCVALVGYTNSGKSTLMNRLTGADCYVADQLFATLDTKTSRWELTDGQSALLSDTVGFIRELPHHLIASFRATLEQAIHADLLLHVVDVSSAEAWQQTEAVDQVLKSLGSEKVPQLMLLNKVDIADDASMVEMLTCHRPGAIPLSALTGQGIDRLVEEVQRRMNVDHIAVTVWLPHTEGKVINELGQVADVKDRRYLSDGVEMDVRIHRAELNRLRGQHSSLQIITRDDPIASVGADRAISCTIAP